MSETTERAARKVIEARCRLGRDEDNRVVWLLDNDDLDAAVAAAVLECRRDQQAAAEMVQVGWWGPYGLIPGGMDNDPVQSWRPVYVPAALAGEPE